MITLTTDFRPSHYVAQMKAVIWRYWPQAHIVDLSHDVEAQNVLEGAFVMAAAAPWFSDGSVHVGVVDPGVGTDRRAIAIRCRRGWLVGPDNGLLWPAAKRLHPQEVRSLEEPRYFNQDPSPTFYGRDVFAPVAANIAADARCFERLGPLVEEPVKLELEGGTEYGHESSTGTILHIDRFGNLLTNLHVSKAHLEIGEEIGVHAGKLMPVDAVVRRTYAEAAKGQFVVLRNSAGFLEIACNDESAAARFDVKVGDPVGVHRAG